MLTSANHKFHILVMMLQGIGPLQASTRAMYGFLMIRGVSDHADTKKNSPRVKKWRSDATDATASYAIGLFQSGLIPRPSASGDPQPKKRSQICRFLPITCSAEQLRSARWPLLSALKVNASKSHCFPPEACTLAAGWLPRETSRRARGDVMQMPAAW